VLKYNVHFRDLLNELNFTRSNGNGDSIVMTLVKEDNLVDDYSAGDNVLCDIIKLRLSNPC